MPVFQIETPDGRTFEVEAPDEQALSAAVAQIAPQQKGWRDYLTDPLALHEDARRAAAQGLTFGWRDPIVAAGQSLIGRGDYESNLARERSATEALPGYVRVPGEIGGAVAGGIAAAPVTAGAAAITGASRLPAVARAIGAGAGGGALFGAGEADPGRRVEGALQGGAIGAGLGPLAVGGAALLSRGAGAVRSALMPQTGAVADVGRALGRDIAAPEGRQEVLQRATAADVARPGTATMLDIGGENVRGVGERIMQTPGVGRTILKPFVSARQTGQAKRLATDLQDLWGTRENALEAIDETMAERASAAQPLYRIANDFDASYSPQIVEAWERETATGYGEAIVRNPNFKQILQTEYGVRNPASAPLMAQIDTWKKVLDDQVGDAVRSGQKNKARVLTEMRDRLLEVVDDANPAYPRARQAWAGPTKFLEAIDSGKDILSPKLTPPEMMRDFSRLGEGEQQAYREGAFAAIVARMGNDPAKLADMTKYLRSPAMREKVLALMPTDEARQKWQYILSSEIGVSETTGRLLGGSPTARRLAERDEAASLVGDLVLDAVTGAPGVSLLRRLTVGAPKWLMQKLRSRTDAEAARMLTDPTMSGLSGVAQRAERLQIPSSIAPPAFAGGALAPDVSQQLQLGGTR